MLTPAISQAVRTVPRPACPICSGTGALLYQDQTDTLFEAPGKWSVRRCQDAACGLCWLDPVAVPEDMALLYTEYYTHSADASSQAFKLKLRQALIDIYEFIKLLPLGVLGVIPEQRQLSGMCLGDLPPGRVLDVGCGDGRFLQAMHQAGWNVAGLDFDAKAIEAARERYGGLGFELKHMDLFAARYPDDSFDAVTMNHVIEHVREPVALLAEVRRILKPGGRLVAITPNAQSWAHALFGECWRGLEIPRHLQIFSVPALAVCARQAGFEKVAARSSAARADMIFGGTLAIQKARAAGVRLHGSREIALARALRSSWMQYREILRWRSHPECGEEAVLIGHK